MTLKLTRHGSLRAPVFLQNGYNSCKEFDGCFNDDLLGFCKNNSADCFDFAELQDIISDIKIKNNRGGSKIAKFTLKTYVFVYQRLMDFPQGRIDYETLTTYFRKHSQNYQC